MDQEIKARDIKIANLKTLNEFLYREIENRDRLISNLNTGSGILKFRTRGISGSTDSPNQSPSGDKRSGVFELTEEDAKIISQSPKLMRTYSIGTSSPPILLKDPPRPSSRISSIPENNLQHQTEKEPDVKQKERIRRSGCVIN